MKSATTANAVAQLRDKDARALFPVLFTSCALAFAVIAVFSIDTLLNRLVANTTGIVLLGLLLGTQFLSAAFATSKLQELVWWREFNENTVNYLRTLPIPKHRLWITKVQLTAVAGCVIVALIVVSALYGIPYIVNITGNESRYWGPAWIMHVMESPAFSITAPFVACGFAAMAVLSFLYTCAPVGARRWRQSEPTRIWIAGRLISARSINAWLIVAIGMVMLAFSTLHWPLVISAALLTASLIAWYLSSYLAFSGANLSARNARHWLTITAVATGIAALSGVTVTLIFSGASNVAYRMMAYALARPLGSDRYTERFLETLSGPPTGHATFIETSLAAYLLDRDTVIALQPRVKQRLDGELQCSQRGLALALLAVDAPRDNTRLNNLLDAHGSPRTTLQNADCAIPAEDFATLLWHFADDARALDVALNLLTSQSAYTRLVGAQLAARIPAVTVEPSRRLTHRLLQSLGAICATRPDPDLRAAYVRAHLHALSQLTLHQSLTAADDVRRALDTDCNQGIAELVGVWNPIVTSQEQINLDFKSAFARDFEFATGQRFNFDLDAITPEAFSKWIEQDIPWDKLDDPMRCFLARQWNLTQRVPHLFAVRHLIKPPTRSFAFGISTGQHLFSESDCG